MSPYKFFNIFTLKILSTIALLSIGMIQAEYQVDPSRECKISCLQIGGNYTHVNIKTDGLPSFSGNLGGVQGSYEYNPLNNIYGGLKATWKQGSTESSVADRKLVYVDVQERIGYTYAPSCDDWSITLFSGFGYRYLGHNYTQPADYSIKFKYNEFYVPLGFLSNYDLYSCWSIGLNFTWMPQVYPTVEINPLKGAHWTLKNTLDNVLVELPLTYFLTEDKCFSLILKPFYEHWEDGQSTAKTSSGEELGLPKNSYNFWGAELNMLFLF